MSRIEGSTSSALTKGIRVEVESFYVPKRSNPTEDIYFFAYRIVIKNEGSKPAQLVSRHWKVRNSLGHMEPIEGEGVVGEQPRIEPGGQFEYTSFCPLPTHLGSMEGTYSMVDDDGKKFEAVIAPFRLIVPHILN